MRKNKFNFGLVVLLVITASSSFFFDCNSSKENKQKKENPQNFGNNVYFPVASGLTWEYVNEAPRTETELFTAKISGVTKEGANAIAEYLEFPYFSKQKTKATIKVAENGDVFLVDSTTNYKLLMPEASKLKKGYEWKFGDWSARVGDTGMKVKTESEDFDDCVYLNYALGGFTFSAELWVAKDRGIVKWGYHRTNPPSPTITYYVLK
jgi:hypothetical protein